MIAVNQAVPAGAYRTTGAMVSSLNSRRME